MKKPVIITIILIVLVGIGIGTIWGDAIDSFIERIGSGTFYLSFLMALVAMWPLAYIHTILHETGHLLTGKLSGYRFVSFRVHNQMLVKESGKLVRKKYNVVGTGGQCLMSPPDMKNGTFPLALYNLGGVLMNFLLGGLSVWLFLLLPAPWSIVFLISAFFGITIGLTNSIPLRIGGMPNDGYNVLLLRRKKNAAERQAFWVVLRANAVVANGGRARDIPPAWFDWVDIERLDDPLVASAAILRYNYLLDRQELTEARAFAKILLEHTTSIPPTIQNELQCELLFHELISECREEEINRIYTNDLQAYIKATATYASRQRLLYAYARLFLKDNAEAATHLDLFQKACKKSASLGEIPGEQELVALVDKIATES